MPWLVMASFALTGCSSDAVAPDDAGGGDAGTGSGLGGNGGAPAAGNGGASLNAGSGMAGLGDGGTSAGAGALAGASAGGVSGGGTQPESGSGGASGAGDGGGSGGGAGGGQSGSPGTAPTFTELWNQTLESGCAVPYCHDGSGKGWSGFDKATAHRTLVGAASTTCPGETRVVAGNPDESVLAAAVSHSDLGSCDVPPMPRNQAKLPQADIDRVIAWIRAGARND